MYFKDNLTRPSEFSSFSFILDSNPMVYVFPVPVCPYTIIDPFDPCKIEFIVGKHVS